MTTLPDDIKRFILTHIASIPHLEALLLVRGEPARQWDVRETARRLFLTPRRASRLLEDLEAIGMVRRGEQAEAFVYGPASKEAAQLVQRLAEIYGRSLIAVTELVHSRDALGAQQFAEAFKLRKEP